MRRDDRRKKLMETFVSARFTTSPAKNILNLFQVIHPRTRACSRKGCSPPANKINRGTGGTSVEEFFRSTVAVVACCNSRVAFLRGSVAKTRIWCLPGTYNAARPVGGMHSRGRSEVQAYLIQYLVPVGILRINRSRKKKKKIE